VTLPISGFEAEVSVLEQQEGTYDALRSLQWPGTSIGVSAMRFLPGWRGMHSYLEFMVLGKGHTFGMSIVWESR
jgi:hypothetical protein